MKYKSQISKWWKKILMFGFYCIYTASKELCQWLEMCGSHSDGSLNSHLWHVSDATLPHQPVETISTKPIYIISILYLSFLYISTAHGTKFSSVSDRNGTKKKKKKHLYYFGKKNIYIYDKISIYNTRIEVVKAWPLIP